MTDFKELRKIINSSKMNVKKHSNGVTAVTDSSSFRGMSLSALTAAQELIEASLQKDTQAFANKCGIKQLDTLQTITERANRNIGAVMDCIKTGKNVGKAVKDNVKK